MNDGVAGRTTPAQLTFHGHATVSIDLPGGRLVTDPILRPRITFLTWVAPPPKLAETGDVDAVLVSHLHHDHCDLPSLAMLGRDRPLIVPWGTARFFRSNGFHRVVAMRPGDVTRVADLSITATYAAHDGRRRPRGPWTAAAVGYLIDGGATRIYFAGDTALFPEMRELTDVGCALLPVAGWGRTLGPGHLDPVTAVDAIELIAPRIAVPIHWGALRPLWDPAAPQASTAPAERFAAEALRRGVAGDVRVLRPGTRLTLTASGA